MADLTPVLLILAFLLLPKGGLPQAIGKKNEKPPSVLSREQQKLVKKGTTFAKLGKDKRATEIYQQALALAQNVSQCLAISESTDRYGHGLLEVRRACLNKSISLSPSREEFFRIALKARQDQLYEITKSVIDSLIASAQNSEELFDLARKAQAVSLNDVAHLALQTAYTKAKTVSEALAFAKQAKLLGMEDLCRKAIRDLIEDESDAHELCLLLAQIDPLQEPDLNRLLLKRAVDCIKDVDQCKEVFDLARRYDQRDIVALASYRGRKMILLQQYKEDQARYQQQLEQWRSGQADAQEQQAANEQMRQRQAKETNTPGF